MPFYYQPMLPAKTGQKHAKVETARPDIRVASEQHTFLSSSGNGFCAARGLRY